MISRKMQASEKMSDAWSEASGRPHSEVESRNVERERTRVALVGVVGMSELEEIEW